MYVSFWVKLQADIICFFAVTWILRINEVQLLTYQFYHLPGILQVFSNVAFILLYYYDFIAIDGIGLVTIEIMI